MERLMVGKKLSEIVGVKRQFYDLIDNCKLIQVGNKNGLAN